MFSAPTAHHRLKIGISSSESSTPVTEETISILPGSRFKAAMASGLMNTVGSMRELLQAELKPWQTSYLVLALESV